jgi:hypothetical protein
MKNILLLNNRSLHLYDFKELRNKYNLRISAVVFDTAYGDLSDIVKDSLDKVHIIPCPTSSQKYISFPEELLCPLVENELNKYKNTWIVTVDELSVLTAASLREKYKLLGPSHSVILNYKSKSVQKEILAQSGIRIPRFVSLEANLIKDKTELTFNYLVQELKSPFILKPTDMGGTIGVEKIDTYGEFCEYLERYDYFSDLIAEEYIEGKLYHCDFIMQEGKYIFAQVCEYLFNGLAYVNGLNHGSLPLILNDPMRAPIIEFCKKANSALGLKFGCFHFEVFVTKDSEIIFLEAAARPAGSGVPLAYTQMFKRNYMNSGLLAEIQESCEIFKNPEEYCFWACFPKKAGMITDLHVPALRSSYHMDWYVELRQTAAASSSVVDKAGMLLAHNQNYAILKDDFYSMKNFKALEVE